MDRPDLRVAAAALAVTAAITAAPMPVLAQDVGEFQQTLLNDLATLEQKYTALAAAVPEADYGWQPAEGVRTIAEVYGHVANANYYFTGQFGPQRPADVGVANAPGNLEELTAKSDIVAALETVFPHVRDAIAATPDEALDDEVTLFGQEYTVRGVMMLLMTHMHEHLGQSIAYARSVGVVPPWSG